MVQINESKAKAITSMIYKECCRTSLADLCEDWGVTTNDFDEFMLAAVNSFQESDILT